MRLLVVLSLSCMLACSVSAPQRSEYLLRTDSPERTAQVTSPARVGLGGVVVAPYLSGRGLVLQTAENQIRAARYHEWAEPLDQGIRRLLRAELSQSLGEDVDGNPIHASNWRHKVDLQVDQLHGSMSGTALLEAGWRISRGKDGSELARHRFKQSQPLAQAGHKSLVDAEIALLKQLAAAIAASLRDLD